MVESVTQMKSETMINVDASVKIQKSIVCEKNIICNPATCSFKKGKNLASTIYNSLIMCDDVIEETKKICNKF